jgi:hypothetical protein
VVGGEEPPPEYRRRCALIAEEMLYPEMSLDDAMSHSRIAGGGMAMCIRNGMLFQVAGSELSGFWQLRTYYIFRDGPIERTGSFPNLEPEQVREILRTRCVPIDRGWFPVHDSYS